MSPERLRAYVVIVTRDILPPVSGTGLWRWQMSPPHDTE